MATFPSLGYPDGSTYPSIPAGTTTVTVTSSSALTTALTNAVASQRILLAAATYSGAFTLAKSGTATAGISIEAAIPGTAIFAAGSSLTLNNAAYATVSGLTFLSDPTVPAIAFRGSTHHCRATRNVIGPAAAGASTSVVSSILVTDTCQHIRIDHNELRNLSSNGHGIEVLGSSAVAAPLGGCTYWRIDHNYLHDFVGGSGADKAAIQCGSPAMSRTVSNGVVERNVCARILTGDRRVISGEMSNLRISGNALAQCSGGVALLVGRNSVLSDNYIIDRANTTASAIPSAGIRIYDFGHEVAYNYVDGVVGGAREGVLLVDSGDQEGASTVWDAHWRVVNPLVERNVLVGNPEGVRIGNNYTLAPTGATIRDNIVVQAGTGVAVTQLIAPVSSALTNNVYYATPATGGMTQGSDTVWRKDGFGPRLTCLQATDAGPTGDTGDADGTGTLISGGSVTPPVDPGTATTAAERLGWGAPLGSSDEFEYTGAPSSTKWNVYNSAGHDGNGVRSPARVEVANGKMVLTGLAGSANTAGLEHKLNQTYGRWEIRARSFYTASPTTPGTLVGGYHPVSIIWPDSDPTGATGGTTTGGGTPVGQNQKFADSFTSGVGSWTSVQTHSYEGSASGYSLGSEYRLNVVNAGTGHETAVRFEVRDGDTAVGSHERCELSSFGKSWNDRDGEEVFYEFDVRFGDPSWNPGWSGSSDWLIFFQWHQVNDEGAPAMAMAVHSDNQVYIEREPDSDFEFMGPLWAVRPGVWEKVVVHVKWSPDSSVGFVQVHLNGTEILPKTFRKTMYSTDHTDPYYVKMGTYRRSSISGTTVVMHDNVRISNPPATTGGGTTTTPRVDWPYGGEYDLLENGEPGEQAAGAFLHYPSLDGVDHQIDVADFPVDLREFHNFAFEWSPNGLKGWVDGTAWFSHSGGAAADRKDLQAMHRGHLTVQLDAFQATGCIASTMELEWVRVYTLTPVAPPATPQSVQAVGIASAAAFGIPIVTGASPSRPPGAVNTLLGINSVLGASSLGYTVTGTGGTPGVQTVSAVGIASAAAFGRPVVSVPDGPPVVVGIGIDSAEAFGRPVVRAGTTPPPAPGRVLVPTLFAVAVDGHTLTPLPRWTSMTLSPVRNSAGSLRVDYPVGAPGFTLLDDSVSANPLRALEIRVWLGGSQEGALGGWLVQKSGDDLTPGSIWTFSGHFHEWILSKAIIAPQPISEANKAGELRFAGATAGLILATVMDQAQSRGALPLVTRDFTTTHDSNGQVWANSISSIKLAPKTRIDQVADKLVELGMVEYEFTAGRVWRAYNPGGRGVDRTSGPSPLTFAHAVNLAEHSRRESSRDAGTAVLVAGSEGFYEFASSPTAQAQLGWRAEVGVDAGQLDSASAVRAVAPGYLQAASAGVAEYAAAVEFGPGAALPLIDYGVGDWAFTVAGSAPHGPKRRRLRLAQLELVFDASAPVRGKAVFNDLITDRVTELYRRLNAISTGDAVVGTSVSTPGGTGDDINPPAAPVGVTVASTFAYQIPGETATLADVSVGWAPVNTDAYADVATAGRARLAALLEARVRAGFPIGDWTFYGQPAWAPEYAPLLKKEWEDDPASTDADTGDPASIGLLSWLAAYEPAHRGGGAVTSDTARYVVQYQYLGVQGVGVSVFDPLNPGTNDGFWETPVNSPTTQTVLVFGNIEGGRALGVRVAAVDNSGNQGPWSDVVAVNTAVDDLPPPSPSRPTVAAGFRLIRVTWDGKGSSGEDMVAAAPDFLSGGGVEIHVAQGIDFTPDRPPGGNGKVDLSLSTTYQATLYDAMTYPVTGLENGVTYFVRLVAVDRNGNASPPSETSDPVTPTKLVTIDYGPDTIDRATIRAAAIGSAEIDLLAVNESHIGSVNASSIVSGVMSADLVNAGRIATPMSATGNKVEFDSSGIRLYQGSTVVGRWQVEDASMLVTGTYLSALAGERINILPDGSFRMYGAAGVDYASIENAGGIVRMRSRADSTGRRSYVNYDPIGFKAGYGTPDAERSKFDLGLTYGVITAPVTGVRLWRHIPPDDGTDTRWHFVTATASGDDSASIVHMQRVTLASNHTYMFGATSDAGIVFDAGFIAVCHNNINPADIRAASFVQLSAVEAKRDITPVRFGELSARSITQVARARSFYYRSDFEPRPDKPDARLHRYDEDGNRLPDEQAEWTAPKRPPVMHVGPMADDLIRIAPQIVHTNLPRRGAFGGEMGLGVGTIAGLAYAAAGELADEIDELRTQVDELRTRFNPPQVVLDQEPE